MRNLVIVAAVLSASAVAWAQDWEGDLLNFGNKIDGTVGVTYDTMYVWRGFRVFDNKSAVHVLADVTLADTGFGASVFGHRANSSGFEKNERWDYTGYYQNALFPDEQFVTNYRIGYVYYNYPQRNEGQSVDLQEMHAVLSWPKLLGIDGLCPSYVLVKMWQSQSDSQLPDASNGFAHIGMLDYGFTVPGLIPEIPEHLIKLHSELVYNDGLTPTPAFPNPDHGFSNAVFGVSTDLDLSGLVGLKAASLVFTPGVFYQVTLDKAKLAGVSPAGDPLYIGGTDQHGEELWGSFGLKYSF
jgi:hypothetical protein